MLSGDSHANWVSDLVWLDHANYDPRTGKGSVGVEFGGSAVSSPSPYGQNITIAKSVNASNYLIAANQELQWSELYYRGESTVSANLALSNGVVQDIMNYILPIRWFKPSFSGCLPSSPGTRWKYHSQISLSWTARIVFIVLMELLRTVSLKMVRSNLARSSRRISQTIQSLQSKLTQIKWMNSRTDIMILKVEYFAFWPGRSLNFRKRSKKLLTEFAASFSRYFRRECQLRKLSSSREHLIYCLIAMIFFLTSTIIFKLSHLNAISLSGNMVHFHYFPVHDSVRVTITYKDEILSSGRRTTGAQYPIKTQITSPFQVPRWAGPASVGYEKTVRGFRQAPPSPSFDSKCEKKVGPPIATSFAVAGNQCTVAVITVVKYRLAISGSSGNLVR